MNELDLQTALHVLVNAHMRLTVRVVECPGTELVYVAIVMQQHKPHCFGIPGASCVDHRIRQRLPAFENGALYVKRSLFNFTNKSKINVYYLIPNTVFFVTVPDFYTVNQAVYKVLVQLGYIGVLLRKLYKLRCVVRLSL